VKSTQFSAKLKRRTVAVALAAAQELPAAPTISDRRFFADAEGDQ
jgi:hypothetical protein